MSKHLDIHYQKCTLSSINENIVNQIASMSRYRATYKVKFGSLNLKDDGRKAFSLRNFETEDGKTNYK